MQPPPPRPSKGATGRRRKTVLLLPVAPHLFDPLPARGPVAAGSSLGGGGEICLLGSGFANPGRRHLSGRPDFGAPLDDDPSCRWGNLLRRLAAAGRMWRTNTKPRKLAAFETSPLGRSIGRICLLWRWRRRKQQVAAGRSPATANRWPGWGCKSLGVCLPPSQTLFALPTCHTQPAPGAGRRQVAAHQVGRLGVG